MLRVRGRVRLPVLSLSLLLLAAQPVWAQGPDRIGGPFSLTDQDGRAVSDRTFHGKPVLLYFGFTSCPDVCPTDLARVQHIATRVRKAGGPAITPIFVSIDPARDTPAKMKSYVSVFGPDMVGLTGTPRQIAAVTDAYHVYYKKVPYGTQGQYMMDHSTFVFLLDRTGRYVDHFGRTADEAKVARQIAGELAAQKSP
ncbi:SCO family protein [Stenotrophomonas rhizophila]|uniref:SCO family protein n=1 Tax=Stenotrophomonas rhizophila TaxID=216778 RepID=UPI0011AA5064|nr:SCO family protein [Stenotrophomonas rhizophila]